MQKTASNCTPFSRHPANARSPISFFLHQGTPSRSFDKDPNGKLFTGRKFTVRFDPSLVNMPQSFGGESLVAMLRSHRPNLTTEGLTAAQLLLSAARFSCHFWVD
jgi:hypothetical protein